jgi:hypothetical protein
MSQHSRPLIVGALASIFAVPAIMGLLMAFLLMDFMAVPLLVFLMGVITTPTTCLVVVPLALLFRHYGRLNAIYMCLMGTVLGALVLCLCTLDSSDYPKMSHMNFAFWFGQQSALRSLIAGAMYGFVSAAAFCVGAGITVRPNRRRNATDQLQR